MKKYARQCGWMDENCRRCRKQATTIRRVFEDDQLGGEIFLVHVCAEHKKPKGPVL